MLDQAARIGDTISHSYRELCTILMAGTALTIGVTVVAIMRRPDKALMQLQVVADCIEIAADIGAYAGSKLPADDDAGVIVEGASRTRIGPGTPLAARIKDGIKCGDPTGATIIPIVATLFMPGVGLVWAGSEIATMAKALWSGECELHGQLPYGAHPGAKIAGGSETVFIEDRNAARRNDRTSCGGHIAKGCETVLTGGEEVGLAGTEGASEMTDLGYTLKGIGYIGSVLGVIEKGMGEGGEVKAAQLALRIAADVARANGQKDLANSIDLARQIIGLVPSKIEKRTVPRVWKTIKAGLNLTADDPRAPHKYVHVQ